MREPLPLATIHDAVLDFLRNRDDAVLFGAQAVNAYVDEARMTQDVDILSTRARELAEEIRAMLAKRFTIAARVREVAGGLGFRVYQLREPKNRHLVDVRQVVVFPSTNVVEQVRVPLPEELIAMKVVSASMRSGQAKGDTDRRDLKILLLAYPHLKTVGGAVADRLRAVNADAAVFSEWARLAEMSIEREVDEDGF